MDMPPHTVVQVADGWAARDLPAPVGATDQIAAALSKAQCAMANPAFDAVNPHFRNKYASLAAVRNAVIPALAKHGIALVQDVHTVDSQIACTTHLYHESGQSLTFGPLVLPVSKADAQGFGSAATYARRYALMAVAGVVGDADDDAEGAVGRTASKISESQKADLEALIQDVGADRAKLLAYLKLSRLEDISAENFSTVCKLVESKRKAA